MITKNQHLSLDAVDLKILKLLQLDGKQTNKELAGKLSMSVTAIYERIKKLERNAVISGYSARIRREALGWDLIVFCQIKLLQHSKKYLDTFEHEVLALDEVTECYHVSGAYDYLLKVLVKDMDHFRDFMVTKLTTLQHIGSTQSSFTINEVKNNLYLPIPL